MNIADLFASLGLRLDDASWSRGQRAIDGITSGLGKILAIVAAYEGVRWFGEQIESTVELGTHIKNLSQSAGVTTDTLQKLGYAASQNGSDMDGMAGALGKLSRTMLAAKDGSEESQKAFASMGIKVTDATGALRPVEDVFGDIADHFKALPNGAQKTADSMLVLGRSGRELIPTLNLGRDGLAAMGARAEELGGILDEKTIDSLHEFEQTTKDAKLGLTGLRNTMVVALLPALEKLVDRFTKWLKANRTDIVAKLQHGAELLGRVLDWLATMIGRVSDVVGEMIDALQAALPDIDLFKTAMVVAGIAMAAAWLAALGPIGLIAVAIVAVTLLAQDLYHSIKDGDGVFADLWATMIAGVPQIGATVAAFKAVIDVVVNAIDDIEKFISTIDQAFDKLAGLKGLAEFARDLSTGHPVGAVLDVKKSLFGGTEDADLSALEDAPLANQIAYAREHPEITNKQTGASYLDDLTRDPWALSAAGLSRDGTVNAPLTVHLTVNAPGAVATDIVGMIPGALSGILDGSHPQHSGGDAGSQEMSTLINGYLIDAAVTVEHSFDSETTDHPVEQGADVTDNTRPKPVMITLECIVSDTPIGAAATARSTGVQASAVPSVDIYNRLLAIRNAREPVTVSTDLDVFDDMVLQSLSIPITTKATPATFGANGQIKLGATRFKATFKQIVIVATDTAVVRVAAPASAAKVSLGNKPAVAATPSPAANAQVKSQSWLKQLTGNGLNESVF